MSCLYGRSPDFVPRCLLAFHFLLFSKGENALFVGCGSKRLEMEGRVKYTTGSTPALAWESSLQLQINGLAFHQLRQSERETCKW
jgi:hypothetical protein